MRYWFIVVLGCMCMNAVARADVRFTVTPLGAVGEADLNNNGNIVLYSTVTWVTILWDGAHSSYLPLSSLPPGYYKCHVNALNDSNQLAGWVDDGNYHSDYLEARLTVFWAGGAERTPVVLGKTSEVGEATRLNASGDVLLYRGSDDRLAVWSAAAGLVPLPTLGGWSQVNGINDAGLVVGVSSAPDGSAHAVTWKDGQIHKLDMGALRGGGANAVTNDGTVVGLVWNQDPGHGILALWSPTGTLQTFAFPGGQVTDVSAVNSAHQVVGQTSAGTFLFQNGTFALLKDLVPAGEPVDRFDGLLDLNDKGQILLTRRIPTTSDPNGPAYMDSVLLTPIPPVARAFSFVNGQHKDASVRAAGRKSFVDAIRLAREASGLR